MDYVSQLEFRLQELRDYRNELLRQHDESSNYMYTLYQIELELERVDDRIRNLENKIADLKL